MITKERLKEVLSYNPYTGVFTWAKARPKVVAGSVAGGVTRYGYRRIRIDGKKYMAHRLAWLYVTGEFPEHEIDHENHNRDDNWFDNLKSVPPSINSKNKSIRKDNKSGMTGVTWNKQRSLWLAKIMVDGKSIILGLFELLDDAVAIRAKANKKYGFHENHGK